MRRWRTILALLCVAVIAAGVLIPADGSQDLLAFLTPVWLEFQPDTEFVVARVDSTGPGEQLVALGSLPAFRGPPASVSA